MFQFMIDFFSPTWSAFFAKPVGSVALFIIFSSSHKYFRKKKKNVKKYCLVDRNTECLLIRWIAMNDCEILIWFFFLFTLNRLKDGTDWAFWIIWQNNAKWFKSIFFSFSAMTHIYDQFQSDRMAVWFGAYWCWHGWWERKRWNEKWNEKYEQLNVWYQKIIAH